MHMFELPEAKRVRREDLRDSSPESDLADDDERRAALEAKLRESFAKSFAIDTLDSNPIARLDQTPKTAPPPGQDDDEEESDTGDKAVKALAVEIKEPEEEEFEFRLFKSAARPAKIVLVDESHDAPPAEGEMIRVRPLSYYIAEPLTEEERENIAFAAISGEEVLRRSKQRWWGMEMPWKVTHIGPATKSLRSGTSVETLSTQAERLAVVEGVEAKEKRKRPGKKRRVAMRTKERAAKKKAEDEDKSRMSKEEHLKEKKKRLNRLRKLKRRAKAQEGKDTGAAADAAESDDDSG